MHNIEPEGKALITTAEAADLLGVAVSTVNRMAARGELVPVVKGAGIRGARHYDRADVEKLAPQVKAVAS